MIHWNNPFGLDIIKKKIGFFVSIIMANLTNFLISKTCKRNNIGIGTSPLTMPP
jgi:hypothetical protein